MGTTLGGVSGAMGWRLDLDGRQRQRLAEVLELVPGGCRGRWLDRGRLGDRCDRLGVALPAEGVSLARLRDRGRGCSGVRVAQVALLHVGFTTC